MASETLVPAFITYVILCFALTQGSFLLVLTKLLEALNEMLGVLPGPGRFAAVPQALHLLIMLAVMSLAMLNVLEILYLEYLQATGGYIVITSEANEGSLKSRELY